MGLSVDCQVMVEADATSEKSSSVDDVFDWRLPSRPSDWDWEMRDKYLSLSSVPFLAISANS